MQDTLYCPICNSKFKNKKIIDEYLYSIDTKGNFIQRVCSSGLNHSILLISNLKKEVVFIKTSLSSNYSKFIEINFINNRSVISCTKNGNRQLIHINKSINPDFPNLSLLISKVNNYINFS